MNALWCELAWLEGKTPAEGVLIELSGERIRTVTAGVAAPADDQALRLTGLTLPGLANAHSHAFQRGLRGRTQRRLGGSFWSWREQMYALAERLDEELCEALSRAAFAEMALAGITLVGEFDYLHHSDAIMRAAAAAGIRLTLLDTCYLAGGLPRFRDADATAWAVRVSTIDVHDPATARLGAAVHSVRAVDPPSIAVVAELARERGWPLHAHVSEQPAENAECRERYGTTPIGVLARAGALSERFTAVHATHLTDDDARALDENGGFCCLCPTTERDLADGIGRPRGRLTLGSDSHAVIDLFEEARAVELDERLGSNVRGTYPPAGLATAATAHGYDSLGWPDGGRIAPGVLADLVTVRLDGPRLAGTTPEFALDAAIFAATAADVEAVFVGGRQIVAGGTHVSLDVAAELDAAITTAIAR
jgi:formiminoglutamate deiminase